MDCYDCGIDFPYLQRAHVVAKHKGGTNDPDNIVKVCPNCHHLRDREDRVTWIRKRWTPEERAKQSKRASAWYKENPEAAAIRAERVSRSMQGNQNGKSRSTPPLKYEWSNIAPKCLTCKTSDRPHKARGLCNACYLKVWRPETGRTGHVKGRY